MSSDGQRVVGMPKAHIEMRNFRKRLRDLASVLQEPAASQLLEILYPEGDDASNGRRPHPPLGEDIQKIVDIVYDEQPVVPRPGIEDALLEDCDRLRAKIHVMAAALRAVETHHIEQNNIKGRDEDRSTTLRIVREALTFVPPDVVEPKLARHADHEPGCTIHVGYGICNCAAIRDSAPKRHIPWPCPVTTAACDRGCDIACQLASAPKEHQHGR